MRVSDIQAWSNCETMALQSPPQPAGRTNVAAWVGTLAHGRPSGIEVEPPERLAFDAITQTFSQADIQAPHSLSLIHISEPRDRTRSRMPSSA